MTPNPVHKPAFAEAAAVSPAASAAVDIPSRAWSWKVCIFLLFATALSYLDRSALGIVSSTIQGEMGLNNKDLGRISAAFFYAYGAGHLVTGVILDRVRSRFFYPACVAAWSIAQMLMGAAKSVSGL